MVKNAISRKKISRVGHFRHFRRLMSDQITNYTIIMKWLYFGLRQELFYQPSTTNLGGVHHRRCTPCILLPCTENKETFSLLSALKFATLLQQSTSTIGGMVPTWHTTWLRRWFNVDDVDATSMTLIQRRNNVVCPAIKYGSVTVRHLLSTMVTALCSEGSTFRRSYVQKYLFLRRWINVNDVDSMSQNRCVPNGFPSLNEIW